MTSTLAYLKKGISLRTAEKVALFRLTNLKHHIHVVQRLDVGCAWEKHAFFILSTFLLSYPIDLFPHEKSPLFFGGGGVGEGMGMEHFLRSLSSDVYVMMP